MRGFDDPKDEDELALLQGSLAQDVVCEGEPVFHVRDNLLLDVGATLRVQGFAVRGVGKNKSGTSFFLDLQFDSSMRGHNGVAEWHTVSMAGLGASFTRLPPPSFPPPLTTSFDRMTWGILSSVFRSNSGRVLSQGMKLAGAP